VKRGKGNGPNQNKRGGVGRARSKGAFKRVWGTVTRRGRGNKSSSRKRMTGPEKGAFYGGHDKKGRKKGNHKWIAMWEKRRKKNDGLPGRHHYDVRKGAGKKKKEKKKTMGPFLRRKKKKRGCLPFLKGEP